MGGNHSRSHLYVLSTDRQHHCRDMECTDYRINKSIVRQRTHCRNAKKRRKHQCLRPVDSNRQAGHPILVLTQIDTATTPWIIGNPCRSAHSRAVAQPAGEHPCFRCPDPPEPRIPELFFEIFCQRFAALRKRSMDCSCAIAAASSARACAISTSLS